jgi:hypothetical protein
MQHHPTPAQGAGATAYTIPGSMGLTESLDRAAAAPISLAALGAFVRVYYLIRDGADWVLPSQITSRSFEFRFVPDNIRELVAEGLLVEVRP